MRLRKEAKGYVLPERTEAALPARSAGGFNLIEVMLALLIMSIILVGTSLMHVTGRQLVVDQIFYQQAAQLASQELEDLKALSYGEIVEGTTNETLTVGENSYQKQTAIALTAKATTELPKPCYKATVTISWTIAEKQHQASYVTYIGP